MSLPVEFVDAAHAAQVWAELPRLEYGDVQGSRFFAGSRLEGHGLFVSWVKGTGSGVVDPGQAVPRDVPLPRVDPPAEGWSRSTPADTYALAQNALSARVRASGELLVAADPAASGAARRTAQKSAEDLSAYAAAADEAVKLSSRAWLPRVSASPQPAQPPATPQRIGRW